MPSSVDDSSVEVLEFLAPEDVLSDSSVNNNHNNNNARSSPFMVSSPDWSDEDDDGCDGGSILEDMDFHFEFLNAKQKVLTRAALYMTREEEFLAFTARRTQLDTSESTTSALWEEAKDLLASMERGGISESCNSSSPITATVVQPLASSTTTTTTTTTAKRGGPLFPLLLLNSKRHCSIDLSVVNHILSCSLEDQHNIMDIATAKTSSSATRTGCNDFVSTVMVDGHWMAKALKKYHKVPTLLDTNNTRMPLTPSSTSTSSSSSSWGIHKDPFGGGDTVLLNPDICATDFMDIEQSLTFTAIPQLIIAPTPPFSVVHANKAFLVFSGLQSHDVIGQAVESLLQNVQPVQDTSSSSSSTPINKNNDDAVANSNTLVGWMSQEHRPPSMPQLPCHVRVVPVVDRRNHNASSLSSPALIKTTSMSHIVLQVQHLEQFLTNAMMASTVASTPAVAVVDDVTATVASSRTNTPIVMESTRTTAKGVLPPTATTNHGHIFGMIG